MIHRPPMDRGRPFDREGGELGGRHDREDVLGVERRRLVLCLSNQSHIVEAAVETAATARTSREASLAA